MIKKLSLLAFMSGALIAQALPPRVLVIYNSHPSAAPDSQTVATQYRDKRGIPNANLCGVSFPNADQVTLLEWTSTYRAAIRNCLDAVGRNNILYVVMSYLTPYRIQSGTNYMALDSYIADIWDANSSTNFPLTPPGAHRYYSDPQTMGNVYPAFQTFAAFRGLPRSSLIYSVWRLDAANLATAQALVDQAKAAEAAGGLDVGGGTAYVDRRYPTIETSPDLSYFAGDHDLEKMAQMAASAGLTVLKDTNDAELGVAPAPLTAPNALLYSGWYTLNNYNDVFTWKTGAIGWHLDSSSLTSPRAGASWGARALARGIAVTSGSINEPFLDGLAHPDVVTRHLLAGGNVGDAFLRGTPWLKWMIINVGDPLYVPFPGGRALTGPQYSRDMLSMNPAGIISGTATATLTLADPAPAGGVVVNWNNNWTPYYVTAVTPVTTIPEGQRTASVSVTVTNPVSNPANYIAVTIGANYSSKSIANSVYITSLLSGISLAPSIPQNVTRTGAVVLNVRAPLGGTVVNLSSSHPALLSVPGSVTVAQGAQVATFPATTANVGVSTAVTITATSGPYVTTAVVNVTP